jgi:CRP-like cAMP-binding protein
MVILQEKIMDYSILSQAPVFKGFAPGEIEKIFKGVKFQVKRYKADSMIFASGEPVNSLIIITDGIVKGEMADYAGRVIKIEDIQAPGAIASAFIFGNRNKFPVNVISITDTELLIIDKPEFLKLLKSEEKILVNFLDMISDRSQFLSEKIKYLNFKTIRAKLAQYILQKAGKEGTLVILDKKQNELAEFFGVARPSVGRAIHKMEEEGLIIADGKRIKIVNKKGLSDLIFD